MLSRPSDLSSDEYAPALVSPGCAVPPATISDAPDVEPQFDAAQQRFYDEHFRPAFLSGAPIDVGKERGYLTKLRFELAGTIDSSPDAPRVIRRFFRAYGPSWEIATTYFLEGDFERGFREYERRIPEVIYLNLAASLGHPRLSALTVLRWAEGHVTDRGIRGLGDVMGRLQEGLDTFHAAHGDSVIEDFWARITAEEVSEETVDEIITCSPGDMSRAEIRDALASAPAVGARERVAFKGIAGLERRIAWPQPWTDPGIRYRFLRQKCRQLVRSAENSHREAAGLPLVGQGWVSEMALLREMQAAFPDEMIVHQARPSWLGRQSLDIFFPDRMIAIEYQGAQHSFPVDFFGGDAAFEAQQERDATKRARCAAVNCTLIEAFPGYVLAELTEQVMHELQRARQ